MDALLMLDEEDEKKLYDGASIINHAVLEKAMPPTIKPSYESRSGLNALGTLMLSAALDFFANVQSANGSVFMA